MAKIKHEINKLTHKKIKIKKYSDCAYWEEIKYCDENK